MSLLPTGDVRDHLLRVIDEATVGQLRVWRAAEAMCQWALALCEAVEAELDAGAPGQATYAWMTGAILGLSRLLIRQSQRDRRPSTSSRLDTAVMLLTIAAGLHRLRRLVPDGQYDLLPVLLPPFLHELPGISPSPAVGNS